MDVHLGVTLYKFFKNTNYSNLSNKFGIGEAIAHDIVVQTIAAIVKCLGYKIQFLETAMEGVCDAQKRFLSTYVVIEAEYNQQHYLAWIVIEQLFRLLKMKFKCLDQKQRIKLKYLPYIIKCCCILHNFLINVGETNINAKIKA
ncbi:hypothetical protein SELMODRAFT_414839 [Selaginella moellendorffii]|uniref:DDE Tnp4 domain-containing protein n=1 Tax=Selaginella moellendorffii TaxID=88036 RepID=D8RUT6_SELML|nr:hypothetical protein SELMODRAFT_414839 [Selaginella moellendorffii]